MTFPGCKSLISAHNLYGDDKNNPVTKVYRNRSINVGCQEKLIDLNWFISAHECHKFKSKSCIKLDFLRKGGKLRLTAI